MVRRVRQRCAPRRAYDVAARLRRQWGQGRGEGWVSKRDEGRKSLDLPRRVGEVEGGEGDGTGTRRRRRPGTHIERRTAMGRCGRGGEGRERLKAGLLVGFNYICLYLHNKQQPRRPPVGLCSGMPVPLLVFSPRSTRYSVAARANVQASLSSSSRIGRSSLPLPSPPCSSFSFACRARRGAGVRLRLCLALSSPSLPPSRR